METRICHICGTEIEAKAFCATCTDMVKWLPNPEVMTPEQRVAEIRMWYGPLEINFSMIHERLSALCGRDLWITELPDQDHIEALAFKRVILQTREQQEMHDYNHFAELALRYPHLKFLTMDEEGEVSSFPPDDIMPDRPAAGEN